MRELRPDELDAAEARAFGGADVDLPPEQRRATRRAAGERLEVEGLEVSMRSRLVFGGRAVHVLGPGRGNGTWLVAWVDNDPGEPEQIQVATVWPRQLQRPPL